MVKKYMSIFSSIIASVLAIWAMLLPPQGEIDSSVLLAMAQFLVFAATLLGVDIAIEERLKNFTKKE